MLAPSGRHVVTCDAGIRAADRPPGLAGPAVAAVAVTWLAEGRRGVRALLGRIGRWRVPSWCWLLVAGTVVLIVATALATSSAGSATAGQAYTGVPDLGLAATFLLVLVVNGIGEETGWRGFLRAAPSNRVTACFTTAGLVAVVWRLAPPAVPRGGLLPGPRVSLPIGWLVGLTAGSLGPHLAVRRRSPRILLVALAHGVRLRIRHRRMWRAPAAVVSTAVMTLAGLLLVRGSGPRARSVRVTRHGVVS